MASIQMQPATTGKKNRTLRTALRVDMTPLVDLGFLLITFFILTTTMAESRVASLVVPADGPASQAGESATMSVLLGKDNKVYVYYGQWADALRKGQVFTTSYQEYSGLGSFVRARQASLYKRHQSKDDLILLIKPAESSTYKNVVDALDEATINSVKRYAIVPLDKEEAGYMASR